MGVFPASLDAGDKGAGPTSATPEAWRFLPQAALALAYLLFCLSLVQWPAEGCLGEALTWEKYWTKMSTMGEGKNLCQSRLDYTELSDA